MRIRTSRCASVVLGVTSALFLLSSPAAANVQGDVNGDCEVDTGDVMALMASLLGNRILTGAEWDAANLAPLESGVPSPDSYVNFGDYLVLWRLMIGDATIPLSGTTIDPPVGDNPISVMGTTCPGISVTLNVRDSDLVQLSRATTVADADGNFSFASIGIDDGSNQVWVVTSASNPAYQISNEQSADYNPETMPDPTNPGTSVENGTVVWFPAPDPLTCTPGPCGPDVPYQVDLDFTVDAGATLVIVPGTQIEFGNDRMLIVNGTLLIQGVPGQSTVDLWVPDAGETCTLDRTWHGIEINGLGSVIEGARIQCTGNSSSRSAVTVNAGGQLTLIDTAFWNNSAGAQEWGAGLTINTGSDVTVSGGSFENYDDGILIHGASPEIRGVNPMIGSFDAIEITGGSPHLVGNIIHDNIYGIHITGGSPIIDDDGTWSDRNQITASWRAGIWIDATSSVPDATIARNAIAWNTDFQNGCIVIQGNCDLRISGALSKDLIFDVRNNYWGSAAGEVIAENIEDRAGSSQIGQADFTPFLDSAGNVVSTGCRERVVDNVPDPPVVTFPRTTECINGLVDDLGQDGRYTLVGDVYVPSSETWTIADGATIWVDDSITTQLEILADGILDINGTSGNRVTFDLLNANERGGGSLPGLWQGIHLRGDGSVIEYVEMYYAKYNVHIEGVDAAIRNSGLYKQDDAGFNTYTIGAAIWVEGGAGKTIEISGNAIDKATDTDPATWGETDTVHFGNPDGAGTGIRIENSSPHIWGNDIQDQTVGIWILGASDPLINDGSSSAPNTIHHNKYAILLEAEGGNEPAPTINDNEFWNATTAAIWTKFESSTTATIDAKRNYWGTTDQQEIRSLFLNDDGEVAIDFSEYKDAVGAVIGGTSVLWPFLQNVTVPNAVFAHTLDAPIDIQFTLAKPGTVTLKIFDEAELDPVAGTPVYTSAGIALGIGNHNLTWDGTDGIGNFLPEKAYVPWVQASNGLGSVDTYFPPDNSGVGFTFPVFVDTVPATPAGTSIDPHRNEFYAVRYYLHSDSRVHIGYGGSYSNPDFWIFEETPKPLANEPQETGTGEHLFLWDMRDPSTGAILDPGGANFKPVFFGIPTNLRENVIIVEGASPEVRGPDTRLAGAILPRIEVRPDPWLVRHSYSQTSAIAYCLDQAATVTIKILKPGVYDPSIPANVVSTPLNAVSKLATSDCDNAPHVETWDGIPGSGTMVEVEQDGEHTFVIEAVSDVDPGFKTVYRGVLHLRK